MNTLTIWAFKFDARGQELKKRKTLIISQRKLAGSIKNVPNHGRPAGPGPATMAAADTALTELTADNGII
jgi:hypothetical protein